MSLFVALAAATASLALAQSTPTECDVLSSWNETTKSCVQQVAGGLLVDDDQSGFWDEANDASTWAATVRRGALPDSVNWNPLDSNGHPTMSGPVKDQKSCGSCTIYAQVYVSEIWANQLLKRRNPSAFAARSPVILSALNQVHCIQAFYGRSKMVCGGNKFGDIITIMTDMQSDARVNKSTTGQLSLDTDDDTVNGPYYALPDACRKTRTIDPLVPLLSSANPAGFTVDVLSLDAWGSDAYRRVFSPMLIDFTPDLHQKKMNSIMAALQYGPLTFTTFLCGDFTFNTDPSLVTYKGCSRDAQTLLRSVAHRVTIVGYKRAATLESSYFIVMNSWGSRWANNGFTHLSMGIASAFYWGEVVLTLVRPVDSLFNPLQPRFADSEVKFSDGWDWTIDGVRCDGPGHYCKLAKNTVVALKVDAYLKMRVPKVVVMKEFRFTLHLNSAKAVTSKPGSLSFDINVKQQSGAWNNVTLSTGALTWRDSKPVKGDDSDFVSANVVLPIDVATPIKQWDALEIVLNSALSIGDASLYVGSLRFGKIDEPTSLQFLKGDATFVQPTDADSTDADATSRVVVYTSSAARWATALSALLLSIAAMI